MSERPLDPCRLDLRAFARTAAQIGGQIDPNTLARFRDGVLPAPPGQKSLAWAARGEMRAVKGGGEPQLWLHLQASTPARLMCQRCLKEMLVDLAVQRSFLFVADEDEAASLDEVLDEDVLVLPRLFDLMPLLEDELILALPLVPRHENCPEPLFEPLVDDEPEAVAPHPFAALAALRKPPLPN